MVGGIATKIQEWPRAKTKISIICLRKIRPFIHTVLTHILGFVGFCVIFYDICHRMCVCMYKYMYVCMYVCIRIIMLFKNVSIQKCE